MEKSNNKHNEIKSFLNKTMTPSQNKKFEEEIKSDKNLENEVNAQKFERAFEYLSLKADLREKFKQIKEEENVSPFWIIFIQKPFIKGIAASLVIGLLGFVIWNSISDYRDRQLAEHQREQARLDSLNNINIQNRVAISPTANDLINASIAESKQQPQENIPKALENAALAYERGNLTEASKLLEKPKPKPNPHNNPNTYGSSPNNTTKQTETNPETESYRALYQGLIFLSNKQYKEAIIRFSKVEKPIKEEATWYTALAYLKNDEIQKGIDLLQEIIKNKGKYQSDAENLLKSMQEARPQK